MKISLKPLLYLPIILFFFPAFAFTIPGLDGTYLYFYISIYIALFVMFIIDNKTFLSSIINLIKHSYFKYIIVFISLIFINSILLSLFGRASFKIVLHAFIMKICLAVVPMLIYFMCVIKNNISVEKFIKYFVIIFWINLFVGLIAYIGALYDIDFINNLFEFFANARGINKTNAIFDQVYEMSGYVAFGLPRLDNLYAEPAYYARFLLIFLPLVYTYHNVKFKIINNNILDFILKKTIIPLTWLNIILTFSPIYFIFSILLTIVFYRKSIIKLLKKYFIVVILTIIILLTGCIQIDLSETFLSRIINVMTSLDSFDSFILVEPSLGTRISSFINVLCVFFKNIFCGIGFGELPYNLQEQFINSPVLLTYEIIQKTSILSANFGIAFYNSCFIYDTAAENGIFILSIFVYLSIKMYKALNVIVSYYSNNKNSTEYINAFSVKCVFITLICSLFYSIYFIQPEIWLVFAVTIIYIHTTYLKIGAEYE